MKWNPPSHIEMETVGVALPLKGYTHPTTTAQGERNYQLNLRKPTPFVVSLSNHEPP